MEPKPGYYIVRGEDEGGAGHLEQLGQIDGIGGKPRWRRMGDTFSSAQPTGEILAGPFTIAALLATVESLVAAEFMAQDLAAAAAYDENDPALEGDRSILRPEGTKPLDIKEPPILIGQPTSTFVPWMIRFPGPSDMAGASQ